MRLVYQPQPGAPTMTNQTSRFIPRDYDVSTGLKPGVNKNKKEYPTNRRVLIGGSTFVKGARAALARK
jgi:hypothetical protein